MPLLMLPPVRNLLLWFLVFVWLAGARAPAAEADYQLEAVEFQEQNFVGGGPSNQFPRAHGVYAGLIMPTNTFVAEQSGYFYLTIFSDRDFTGRVNIAGNVTPLRGHFNRQGQAGVLVYRKVRDDCFCFDCSCPFTLRLVWIVSLNLIPDTDQIQGTIENVRRGWSTTLFGYRGYASVDGPAPEAGRYTLHLPGTADSAVAPAGEGFGALTVDLRGRLQIHGALADGTPFSRSAVISTNGWWPFYVPVSDGRGALQGWLRFNSLVSSDISGDLLWVKPRREGRTFYPDGFTGPVPAHGERYTPPPPGGAELSWTNGIFRLAAGNLSAPVTNTVSWPPGGDLSN